MLIYEEKLEFFSKNFLSSNFTDDCFLGLTSPNSNHNVRFFLLQNVDRLRLSLTEKYKIAWNERDISAYLELHHDDYEMIFHSTGEVQKLEEFGYDEWADWMIASEIEQRCCLYENEDILVEHQNITYSSGDREALMLVHLLKDCLLWRTESGATPLPVKE